uniref:Protein RUFY3 n=1 Tax=Cacopsylla melanoneura TaxID=428564 RepID=A0A8D9B2J1_9HEMI
MLDTDLAGSGAQDTIYLCNFRVSVDGEWLCLKQLEDVEVRVRDPPELRSPSPEPPLFSARNPVIIERRNLVNISKLIVKELIETSQKHGRMLDSDHMPLQHFFIVLEHVLRHGLKPKKGLLGPKKELWDILQLVEKLNPEAADITASVRDLPTVKTHMGRARAWLRLALMQKKLADYLQVLVDHRDDILIEYFEIDALLMSDEAIVILGKLLSLNVIDCNLCVKEEDLDCQQGVIDFSLYLRSACYHHDHPEEVTTQAEDNMSLVLDQKNYIEELNRHLNATVGNLQTQVESLTTTNALMREDLSIAEKNLRILIQENENLKNQLNTSSSTNHVTHEEKPDSQSGNGDAVLKKTLEDERKQRQDMERELHLQVGLKAEMEVAMKLLERDVHQKQDTIIELRRQLEDIKMINLEMYKKLQECEEDISEKTEMVSRLQMKTLQIGNILTNLQKGKPPGTGSHTPGSEGKNKPGSLPCSQSVSAISMLTLSDELRAKVDRLTSGGGLKRSFDDHVKMNKITEHTSAGAGTENVGTKMNKLDDFTTEADTMGEVVKPDE